MEVIITKLKNWAGNYQYSTTNVHYPKTVDQIQALVERCEKLRVLGTRHSFNTLADSSENLLSLDRFAPTISIDAQRRTATIAASVKYGDLSQALYRGGFALHNLASLGHISVVGACATATHGSGVGNQNLAAAIASMTFVSANGDLIMLSRDRDGDLFNGAVVHLGGLGVVVSLTLDLLPTFDVSQNVYERLPIAQLDDNFDEIMSSAYSVSLFTDWQHDYVNQIWLKARHEDHNSIAQPPEFFGARPATREMHPIAELSAEQCTVQLGVRGAWHERLPHFRIDATPSAGAELQTEYFVPRARAVEAMRALRTLSADLAPLLMITEIRTIAADDFWISPCYHQDSVAFHFTWQPDWSAVNQVLPLIEAQLAPFNARPHWGKLFTIPPQRIQSFYEKLPQFRDLLHHYDPQGKFRNTFLDTNIMAAG